MYEGAWHSVKIDGGKLDFLNLRGSKLTDVVITGCIINELDHLVAAVFVHERPQIDALIEAVAHLQ